ncbi:MAG: type II toxin-antitoxin system RelE family toxin [Thermoplasmatota archaeon]
MVFVVIITDHAERHLRSLPPHIRRRFVEAMEELARDPFPPHTRLDVKKLRGLRRSWRLRVGAYRGIYEVEGDRLVFTRFAHRSAVYRF